ncbi:MAG: Gfo/Idh/MocA family oxidoreductase [Cyanobacteria bacterium J06636_28]
MATPAPSHYALALAALKAGKDVFVEKPMTLRAAEAGGRGCQYNGWYVCCQGLCKVAKHQHLGVLLLYPLLQRGRYLHHTRQAIKLVKIADQVFTPAAAAHHNHLGHNRVTLVRSQSRLRVIPRVSSTTLA